MHLVVTLRAGAGVRLVCELLTLSGLSALVGASYGSQYAVNVQVQDAVAGQAQELRATLAVDMPPREVAVCEDETFHPEICLVAIEPVSNFILLEQYAADRTAATWTQALETALEGLAVTVVQGASDEAKALRRHIEKDRGAQHASDLFHGQQEVSKGTSLHLARQVQEADAAVAAAQAHLDATGAQRAFEAQSPVPRPAPGLCGPDPSGRERPGTGRNRTGPGTGASKRGPARRSANWGPCFTPTTWSTARSSP